MTQRSEAVNRAMMTDEEARVRSRYNNLRWFATKEEVSALLDEITRLREASAWKEYPKEKPELHGEYIVTRRFMDDIMTTKATWNRLEQTWQSSGILAWMQWPAPFNPLPELPNREGEEGK